MFHTKWIFQSFKPKFSTDISVISAPFWNFVPNSPFFRASFWRQVSSCDATMSTNRRAEEDRSAGKQQGGRCSSLVQMQTLFTRSSTNCENPNKGKLQLFSWINLLRNAKTPNWHVPIISDIVFHSKQPKLQKIVKKLLKWVHFLQDSACHTEISAVLGRAVARPLLEKTFHMKIQSR